MPASPMTLKKQELRRRVEALPSEVRSWKQTTKDDLDQNAHFSQVRAIEILMTTFVADLRGRVDALAPDGPAIAFSQASFDLVLQLIKAQECWDYFRDKLDLRHAPTLKEPLWVADTVAWDCHRPVLNLAAQLGVVDPNEFREPPLVYCTADYSPATWTRGRRPYDGRRYALGEATLPIPVIELPWDHLDNSWEYLSLHHEVGHDIEADLELRPELQKAIERVLGGAHIPTTRIATWLAWQGEVFADLCALRLAGPAFADALMHLLMLPVNNVKIFDPNDPHPTPYLRMLMNAAYIRALGATPAIQAHAVQLEERWTSLYGATSDSAALDALQQDFKHVFAALVEAPLDRLKQHSVAELLPFTVAEDMRIRSAEKYFRTGTSKPNGLALRHAPSAARLAVDAANEAGTLSDTLCGEIHGRVLAYVREAAPSGLRGGGPDAHEKFIARYAGRMFQS